MAESASRRSVFGMASGVRDGRLGAMVWRLSHSYGTGLALLAAIYVIGNALSQSWALLITWPMTYSLIAVILCITGANGALHYANATVAALTYPLGIASVVSGIEDLAIPGSEFFVLYAIGSLIIILRDILTRRTVTTDVVLGAVTAYVLLGVSFALIYNVVANIDANAFVPPQDPGDGMYYFSFVTLTTVGFGDIAPAAGWVRSVAVLEGLAGQMFLVVLVARLVGLEIAQSAR